MLKFLQTTYVKLVPLRIRQSAWVARLKKALNLHNAIYDADYYEKTVEGPAVRSAPTISHSVVSDLAPKSVIDVGCGGGALLEALRDAGCEVFGLEYSKVALEYCRNRLLKVEKLDLERDEFKVDRHFDVAVSLEVAEHLPETAADRYVNLLTRLAPVVVMTAAQPGQGGRDHVNEQPQAYWVAKFQQRAFAMDESLTQRWRVRWEAAGEEKVRYWYYKNLMIFRKSA